MNKQPDVSIILLTYNTRELTLRAIESIYKTVWPRGTKEILVVDNASTDQTVEAVRSAYPEIRVIQNPNNCGFAAGNNVGIRRAKGRYILLLNSDTEVNSNSIPDMVSFMDGHPKCGVSTCFVRLPNGEIDPASHRGFPTPWAAFSYLVGLEKVFPRSPLFGQYHQGYKDMRASHQIDCPSGAFFLVRRDVIDQVGLLDEEYFMYGEDIDWAYRIKEKGWEVWFNPHPSILHIKKQSGRSHSDGKKRREMDVYFLTTMRLFYKKHYEKQYGWFVTRLVYVAIDLQIIFKKIF